MVKVLLTGGSGFIAAHVLESLLADGHTVVTTVRSDTKGKRILEAHPKVSKDKLSYVLVEDIAKDGAFDKAVVSDPPFEAVVHTASPFYFGHDDPVKDILDPAVKGTTGILKAIKKSAPSVKRVVITSSFAAIVKSEHPKVYDETVWNPVTWEQAMEPSVTYRGSKTFAERAAWDFVKNEKPNFDLVTMNPPLVFGPIVNYLNSLDAINTSNQVFRDMAQGKMKDDFQPTETLLWVDVRDLATAHAKAVTVPEAGGNRFFVTAGFFSNKQIVDAIRKTHPELDDKLPPADTPDDLPKELPYDYDNSKSKKILGLTYHSLEQMVGETITSIQAVEKS